MFIGIWTGNYFSFTKNNLLYWSNSSNLKETIKKKKNTQAECTLKSLSLYIKLDTPFTSEYHSTNVEACL